MNKLVVLDANAYWTEQLFVQSARQSEVLLIKPHDFRVHRERTGSFFSNSTAEQVSINVWQQRMSMPPGWMRTLWSFSEARLRRAIESFVGSSSYTLVITYPQYRSLVSTLNPTRSIYYNFDDYRDNWPRYRRFVSEWEAETVRAVDATVCIAQRRTQALAAQHPEQADQIYHIPIGCTPRFMSNHVISKPHGCPVELSAYPRPRAGYIGALNYRFDFRLLADAAIRLPEVTFVLGGTLKHDGDENWSAGLKAAQQCRNVHFFGWVDHARLGEFLNEFDVLLMPYSQCHFNTNACPAKLWDYLGTGKPIVANDANPETLLWRDVVRVATTSDEFTDQIRAALADHDQALIERRLAIALDHTWDRLNRRIEPILF